MFNKLFLKALVSISFCFAVLTSANASLITQDILFNDQGTWSSIGEISVDTADADEFGFLGEWDSFNILGFNFWSVEEAAAQGFGNGVFMAVLDLADLAAGIQFLTFDVTESNLSTYAFNGLFDVAPGQYFIDAFNANGIALFGEFKLGDAVVTGAEVPEPQTALLLLMAVAGLMVRRKSL
ncbi:PEP-CTERM sorting domain-containing protein [Thalassomonas viridans]|uniref:PEP-CTERM sorting domain-containing protein n=1 Tax=Thalassomonas viridans TaxID=137584 RepID=A0AAF0CBE5_9GAMM|nr:PEP-CTERM sorting domain-containing protein [Thalassomonas viridans]WDE06584.1 PEP-CTERM sorting domain-containing protein [Thalassomonas viridans]